jgi:hypothetical protein
MNEVRDYTDLKNNISLLSDQVTPFSPETQEIVENVNNAIDFLSEIKETTENISREEQIQYLKDKLNELEMAEQASESQNKESGQKNSEEGQKQKGYGERFKDAAKEEFDDAKKGFKSDFSFKDNWKKCVLLLFMAEQAIEGVYDAYNIIHDVNNSEINPNLENVTNLFSKQKQEIELRLNINTVRERASELRGGTLNDMIAGIISEYSKSIEIAEGAMHGSAIRSLETGKSVSLLTRPVTDRATAYRMENPDSITAKAIEAIAHSCAVALEKGKRVNSMTVISTVQATVKPAVMDAVADIYEGKIIEQGHIR